jgi:hypothetical protein
MNGYLMRELMFTPGEDLFLESFSPESSYGVVFEDDGDTAYFYAVEKDKEGNGLRVLDALHIYEAGDAFAAPGGPGNEDNEPAGASADPVGKSRSKLMIVWSKDWEKCALVIDGYCHALFDFKTHGGYNINEFPPPNEIWTEGDRKLTDELMRNLF